MGSLCSDAARPSAFAGLQSDGWIPVDEVPYPDHCEPMGLAVVVVTDKASKLLAI